MPLLVCAENKIISRMANEWLAEFQRAAGDPPIIVTLATVDRDGSPRARSVVIRHVGGDGSLWFTSDARSDKAAQLSGRNEAEIVAWFAATREQFRLFGNIDSLGPAAVGGMRLRLWQGLSDAVRATFFWPPPGEPRTEPDTTFQQIADAQTPVPATFEALFLEPTQVEQLQLSPHPHRRRRWRADRDWQGEELNP